MMKRCPRHFWKIAIVTGVLPSGDSEITSATVRIKKTNAILKCPVNELSKLNIHIMTQTKQIRQGNKS